MCWCGMIEWTHSWKKFKVNLTENAWNNLGHLSSTLPQVELEDAQLLKRQKAES